MRQILQFLADVAANNNRPWFAEHKNRYLQARQTLEKVTLAFIDQVALVDPDARRLTVADCTYRIYRDTRFSPDKRPYKTHIGIFVNPPYGKKSIRLGYYLHLEPGACMICAGTIGLPSPVMRLIRQSIVDCIDEYRSIVEDPEFQRLLPNGSDERLKTAPQGFDRNWPFIDYLRPKNFIAWRPLADDEVCRPDFLDSLLPTLRQAKRYNDFINYSVDEYLERDK